MPWLVDDKLAVHEDFLGFCELPNLSAMANHAAVTDILLRLNLWLDCCRGQCYEGE